MTMDAADQLALFKRVQQKYRNWSQRKVSGYVHGVVDEDRRDEPDPVHMTGEGSQYSIGYLAGFADARGEDVLDTGWWRQFSAKLEYRWWEGKG